MLIYKEFFKNTKMSQMLLWIGFVRFLIFCLFSKFTVIKKNNYKRTFNEGKYLPWITVDHNLHREFPEAYRDLRFAVA